MMRGANDDSPVVRRLAIQRVISIKRPAPHSRPKEIGFQTKQQFEDTVIELMAPIIGAERILHPCCQTRCLIVEEYATIFDPRRLLYLSAALIHNLFATLNGHISPPIPGRDTYLLTQLIDAVDRATLVTAYHHQLAVYHIDEIALPLPTYLTDVYFVLLHPTVDQPAMSKGPDQDTVLGLSR